MGTHADADGIHRESSGTPDGGKFAVNRLPEQSTCLRDGHTRTHLGSLDAVDAAMDRLVSVSQALGQLTLEEERLSTPEGARRLEELRLDFAQANYDANEATHLAGAAGYAELGQAGAEEILSSVQFHLPADAASLAVVAHAAMHDTDFALEVFNRAGERFVSFLDTKSLAMILDHESEEVRAAAVLAGAAERRGNLTTAYIGRYPTPVIVEAANARQEITGKPDRFFLDGDRLVSESAEAGIASDRLATLARTYEWSMLAPHLRAAA